MVFLGPVGSLVYFIWALRHKPAAPEDEVVVPPVTASGARALSKDDLAYLEQLADLHECGVLSDEQYAEQRRERTGE